MTLTEIQATIDALRVRHPGMQESLLITLLQAGGWEKVSIEEAKTLFRLGESHDELKLSSPHDMLLTESHDVVSDLLPSSHETIHQQEEVHDKTFLEQKEAVHEYGDAEPLTPPLPEVTPVIIPETEERQSLITSPAIPVSDVGLPENLPLKPFDTSSHVWSFSKYKDVFHGVSPSSSHEQRSDVLPQTDVQTVEEEHPPLTKEDESLVFLAGFLLSVVLFILGYMYSLGRL